MSALHSKISLNKLSSSMQKKSKTLALLAVSTLAFAVLPLSPGWFDSPAYAVTAESPNEGAVAGIEIAESAKYEILAQDISVGKNGNILLVWNQEELTGTQPTSDPISITFAITDSEGTLISGPTEIAQVPYGDYYYRVQMVTYNESNDEWLVVWSDGDNQFMQRVASDGTLVGATVTMSKYVTLPDDRDNRLTNFGETTQWAANDNGPLQVSWDPVREEYLVTVWDDNDLTLIAGLTGQRVWGNFYNSDLEPVDGNADLFLIGAPEVPANSDGDGMSIALDQESGIWAISYNSNVNPVGRTSKIVALLDRSAGGLTQTTHAVVDNFSQERPVGSGLHNSFPQVTFVESTGNFLVTFNAKFDSSVVAGADANSWQTYGRWIDGDGNLVGTTTRISNIPSLYTDETDPLNPVADVPELRNVRPHYDSESDRLYFAGHASQSIDDPDFGVSEVYRAYLWSLSSDLSDSSDPVPMFAMPDSPTGPGESARPAIDIRAGLVAVAYMNWPNGDYGLPAQLQLVLDGTFVPTSESAPPAAPSPYNGPVVTGNSPTETGLSLIGTDLDQVSSVLVGEYECELKSLFDSTLSCDLPTGLAGDFKVTLIGSFGKLFLSNIVSIRTALQEESSELELATWTKNQNDGTVKMYAKNIVGAGKVQFMFNGEEIAWVRAVDGTDPKLRMSDAGAYYLVRTVELVEGQKNVFEIYVDGVRTTRTAYTY